jgi:endonuclease YncB( thermonuclease family)
MTWVHGIALFFVAWVGLVQATTTHEGKIFSIADGDTVTVSSAGKRLKIRMVGMDSPEAHLSVPGGVVSQGKFGSAGTKAITAMIPVGTSVRVEQVGVDKYKRILGRVFKDDKDINLAMIEVGWAIPYIICEGDTCDRDFFVREKVSDYINACRTARQKGLGIFDPKDPLTEMPFEFRIRMQRIGTQPRKPDKYVGDYESKVLYAPDDYKQIDVCQRIFFWKFEDAEKAGYALRP